MLISTFSPGGGSMAISPVGRTGFVISLAPHEEKPLPRSIFLDDGTSSQDKSSVASNARLTENGSGIASSAGEIIRNSGGLTWSLRDSSGRTLIDSAAEPRWGRDSNHPEVIFVLPHGKAAAAPIYGSGNATHELIQSKGNSHLDNGVAVVPFYWSTEGYAAFAVSADDNAPAKWHLTEDGNSIEWDFLGERADLYLIPAATFAQAARGYAEITGAAGVPPRWTFGYLQSRWGWKDKAYIDDAEKHFLDDQLPVDAFIFDFEWYTTTPDYGMKSEGTANFHDFGWNPALFPDPAGQIAELHSKGIHFVGIRKPRLGNDQLLKMIREKGWNLPQTGHQLIDLRGLNFRDPAVRDWYAQQMEPLLRTGIDGWWDDEGEITYTTYYYWNLAERQALDAVKPDERLWTIDRAFQPGVRRFGVAAWTGDIRATWARLASTPADLLNWGLAGMPYAACDIGGFAGQTTPELLTRWMEAGVYFPVMRSHSENRVEPHFPWLYGPEAEAAIRKALQRRYELIPVYYSLAHEAHETGMPIMRPLFTEFPDDPATANLSSEWLIGRGLLAAPILAKGDGGSVYLPKDRWYRFGTSEMLAGPKTISVNAKLDEIPAFVRAGTILPLAPPIQHTDQLPGGDLQLQVYTGADGEFTLYEDDGHTLAYLKGDLRQTRFAWNDATRKLSWTIHGPYHGDDLFKAVKITVFDPGAIHLAHAALESDGSVTIDR
jgi:alpha-glucosidase